MPLDPDQINKLRLTVSSAGWNDVVEPAIARRAQEAIKGLVLLPSERSGEFKDMTDDQIRIRIKEAEWFLAVWRNEIRVHDFNRQNDELMKAESQDGPAGPDLR